jgi:hypothetical protein
MVLGSSFQVRRSGFRVHRSTFAVKFGVRPGPDAVGEPEPGTMNDELRTTNYEPRTQNRQK